MENGRLTEIFRLIEHLLHVDGGLADQSNYFIDLTALYFVKNGLMEGVLLARLLQVVHFS